MGRNTDFIYSSRSFAKSLLGQEFFQGQEIEWGTCHLVFITCSIFFVMIYSILMNSILNKYLCVVCCMTRRDGKEHITMLSVLSLFLTFRLNIYFLSVFNP